MRKIQIAIIMIAMADAMNASAAITPPFTDEAKFLGAINSGYYLNEFNDLTPGDVEVDTSTGSKNYSGGSGPFKYEISSSSGSKLWVPENLSPNLAISTFLPDDTLHIKFTSGNVTAVGGLFFLTNDTGEDFGSGTVHVTLSDSTVVVDDFAASSFWGFVTSAGGPTITSLSFSNPNKGHAGYPTLDHFYVGTAVPVPSTYLAGLSALGILGLFGFMSHKCLIPREL